MAWGERGLAGGSQPRQGQMRPRWDGRAATLGERGLDRGGRDLAGGAAVADDDHGRGQVWQNRLK